LEFLDLPLLLTLLPELIKLLLFFELNKVNIWPVYVESRFTYSFLLLEPHALLILQELWVPRLLHVKVCNAHVRRCENLSIPTYLRHPS